MQLQADHKWEKQLQAININTPTKIYKSTTELNSLNNIYLTMKYLIFNESPEQWRATK